MHKNAQINMTLNFNRGGENNFDGFIGILLGSILTSFGLMNRSSKGGKLSFTINVAMSNIVIQNVSKGI